MEIFALIKGYKITSFAGNENGYGTIISVHKSKNVHLTGQNNLGFR